MDKREGEFSLIHGMAGPGFFHLVLADPERYSQAFANVYFGTLLKAGADLKATDPDGNNALITAAATGDLPTAELLLEAGLGVSHRSKDGETTLMVAAKSAHGNSAANLILVLLKAGADVNAQDNKGKTALMHAAESSGPLEVLRVLLEAGADPQSKDKEGHTALELAAAANSIGAKEKAELLQAVKRR